MHIKDRLSRARAKPDESYDVEMYKAWQEGVRQSALQGARLEAKQEIEPVIAQYKAQTEAAEARAAAAQSQVAAAQAEVVVAQGKITSSVTSYGADAKVAAAEISALKQTLAVVKSNWEATKASLSKSSESLVGEQLKVSQLMIRLDELAAKINVTPVIPKTVIPEFEFTPTRDMEGYATKWTAKPKGLN
jgi:hypothetical protein